MNYQIHLKLNINISRDPTTAFGRCLFGIKARFGHVTRNFYQDKRAVLALFFLGVLLKVLKLHNLPSAMQKGHVWMGNSNI
jgi:hypothetical protein